MRTTILVLLLIGCGATAASEPELSCPEPIEPTETAGADDAMADMPSVVAVPAEVRALATAPRRNAPNDQAQVTLLAQGHNAFVARLSIEPGAAIPEHQDTTEEYIHVLEGTGTITIDGTEHAVAAGSTIFMPANATVSFQNGDARMVALQVFAGPEPAAKYERWTPAPP